jgi:transposase InsO family protein
VSWLANLNLIPKFDLGKGSKCQVCVQSKQPLKPRKVVEVRNLAPLDLIHFDLCEMNEILTKGGKRYFITFIYDSTRFCYVYLLKSKDEALHYFKTYKAKVGNQIESKIKRLRSNRGREYFSGDFSDFCVEHGIIHELSYSPQSNGLLRERIML